MIKHDELRNILMDAGGEEFGDAIIDQICKLFGYPDTNQTEVKERGAASIIIKLSGGVITVTHGTDGVDLTQWTANAGDWEEIWKTINRLKLLA